MSEELKPCPLCGRSIQLYYKLRESDHPYDDDLLEAWPSCHCPLSLKESAGYGEEEEQKKAKIGLIEYWNILPRYPRPLRWTKEPPKEPGWYWVRDYGKRIHIVDVGCNMTKYEPQPHREWAGPIPKPRNN